MAKLSNRKKGEIKKRAKGRCEYCRTPANYAPSPFPNEHITPSSKGGLDDLANMAFACNGCNWFKAQKTTANDPKTNLSFPLFNPRQQQWIEHFQWSTNFLKIEPITPIGRATIEALKLNRDGLINLRFALLAIGVHPPKI